MLLTSLHHPETFVFSAKKEQLSNAMFVGMQQMPPLEQPILIQLVLSSTNPIQAVRSNSGDDGPKADCTGAPDLPAAHPHNHPSPEHAAPAAVNHVSSNLSPGRSSMTGCSWWHKETTTHASQWNRMMNWSNQGDFDCKNRKFWNCGATADGKNCGTGSNAETNWGEQLWCQSEKMMWNNCAARCHWASVLPCWTSVLPCGRLMKSVLHVSKQQSWKN